MGIWQRIFGKKQEQPPQAEAEWKEIVYYRDKVNFHDPAQRERFVGGCLEQIREAEEELSRLSDEYAVVTQHLKDAEELERLPRADAEAVRLLARRLEALEAEWESLRGKRLRLTEEEYEHMKRQEGGVEEGISKLREAEGYNAVVKQDLQRLDRERHAYEYRRNELETMLSNAKGSAVIFLASLAVCLVILLFLQYGMELETKAGYVIAIGIVAPLILLLAVRYGQADRELLRVERDINRLIQLQNKVKLRYVNNIHLLEYLYLKYNTKSCGALERVWRLYREEQEQRRQYNETESKVIYYRKELLELLKQYPVSAPERWLTQYKALLDKREMVEIRHELVERRGALRRQMEYNNAVAETARCELKDITVQYPAYASEIAKSLEKALERR